MIETRIADINVSELMERVRAKAEEIRRAQARPKLPAVAVADPLPRAVLPQPVTVKTERILGAIQTARTATSVSRWVPKAFRGLFRRQGRFNREALRVVESLASTNAQLTDRLRHLSACIEVQDHGLQHLAELRRSDREWMHAVAQIILTADEKVSDLRAELQEDLESRSRRYEDAIAAVHSDVESHKADSRASLERIDLVATEVSGLRSLTTGLRRDVDAAGEHLRNLQHEVDRITPISAGYRSELDRAGEYLQKIEEEVNFLRSTFGAARADVDLIINDTGHLRTEFDRAGEHLRNLQNQVDRLAVDSGPTRSQIDVLTGEFRVTRDELGRAGEHLRNLQSQVDGAVAAYKEPLRLEQTIARLEQRLTDDGSYIKGELAHHRSLMAELNAGGGRKGQKSSKTTAPAPSTTLDPFYVSFEDRFRGPRSEIKSRLEFYLPILRSSKAGTAARPVLDIGCGRGEWLELLKERRFLGRGVDLNSMMCAQCIERGLGVVHGDALEYLRTQKAATLGAVTGFHIIEHLPFETLVELFTQTRRVLKPGGVAIFESPNCKNLVVGASNFNIDPTHRNPVFPDTAQFMLETFGFERVAIEYLSPVDTKPFGNVDEESPRIRHLLYGPQDFAVIGYVRARI
jgi:O-antigen chain-terminating methyltransferase